MVRLPSPAGGEVRITVTMTLTEAQKKALDESYENGAYIQGYVFAVPEATAEGLKQVSHSIPVLAFYGNWTDASMFEAGSWLEYSSRLDTRWPLHGLDYLQLYHRHLRRLREPIQLGW